MEEQNDNSWSEEPTPILPHLADEFLLWLWWSSSTRGGSIDFEDELGVVDYWVDSRLRFKVPDEGKAAALVTGENPSESLEARAAMAGGKVLRELRLGLRREEREFLITLKAPILELSGVQLPQVVKGKGEEALYDRMFLYEELHSLVAALFKAFSLERITPEWDGTAEDIRAWIAEAAVKLETGDIDPDDLNYEEYDSVDDLPLADDLQDESPFPDDVPFDDEQSDLET